MKDRRLLLLVVVLVAFSTLACVCMPTDLIRKFLPKVVVTPTEAVKETPPPEATPTEVAGKTPPPEATPTEAAKPKPPPPGKCFAEVPSYPKAEREAELEAEWQKLGARFGPMAAQMKGEVRVFTTPDPPAKVVKFYETEMPKRGWGKKLALTTEEGGLLAWEKGGLMATFIIGGEKKRTYIIIGCGPKPEAELPPLKLTPAKVPALASGEAAQPPAGEELLPTSPLSEGIEGWERWLQPGARIPGHNEVNLVDDPTYGKVVEFVRTCKDHDGGAAGIFQKLDLDVSGYPHLYVWLVGKVIQEEGGNLANRNPKWFPEGAVQVRIKYLTAEGQEKEWYHGFYSKPVEGADAEHFTRVPLDEWFTYLSPDLMALPEPPARILEFKVYGFGWRFRGQVAKVSFIGSQEATGEALPTPTAAPQPIAGITAKEGYTLAEQKAREWNTDAVLLSAEAEYRFDIPMEKVKDIVDLEGKASKWKYSFIIANPQTEEDKHRWFFVTVSAEGIESFEEGLLAIPPASVGGVADWALDSPEAVKIAEENGGAKFRSQYPDAFIEAELSLVGPFMGYSDTSKNVKWKITYCRKSDLFNCKHFEIDGTTGKVVAMK